MSDQDSSLYEYVLSQDEETLKAFSMRTVGNSAPYVIKYLRDDSHVLDLGCGPGSMTADFAKRCATGRVIGIDNDAGIIEKARAAFPAGEGPSAGPEFLVGDATKDLPFEDATFDVVHGHQFAQFVPHIRASVAEWRRVLKPGGVLALRVVWLPGTVSCPLDTQAFSHVAEAMGAMFRAAGGDPCMLQRDFPAAAKDAGFSEVEVDMDSFTMRAKAMRAAWAHFMLHQLDVWRKLGTTEEQVERIQKGINAVVEAEHGFVIIPSIDSICRL